MKFIIGIGNPGRKYEGTRHNIGFDVLDLLAKQCGASEWKEEKKLNSIVARSEKAMFLKPKTFVNHTGDAIAGVTRYHGAAPSEILVVSDDVNLDFGKLRLRDAGSAGGHHGLESVIAALGSEDFSRLRFGVRNREMPKDLVPFVLEHFGEDEKKQVHEMADRAVRICQCWIEDGFEAALMRLSQLQVTKGNTKKEKQ